MSFCITACRYLTGCRCYTPLAESVVHMGEKSNERFDKPQWAPGRLGDIDFVGVSRTRGKVYNNRYLSNANEFNFVHIIHQLYLSVQFVRVTSSTDPAVIYQMLTKQWGLAPPHLVVALMGGDEVAQMKPWLRDTLRKGLVKAAQSTGGYFTAHYQQKLQSPFDCYRFLTFDLYRGVDPHQWFAFWHHQEPGSGRKGPLSSEHFL